MPRPEDRRQHIRLSLDNRYTLRFELEGKVYRGVEMTNVSLGGLGIKMDHHEAAELQSGTVLRGMVFEHPSLPRSRVDGEVRHIMGQTQKNSGGKVFIGVQFRDPTPGFVAVIQAFIDKQMEP